MSDNHDGVLVVGAGPVGLTMAAELARHGVRSRIIERLPAPLPFCRAIGVTPRTLEVWDDMGIVRRMIDAGVWITGLRSIVDGKCEDHPVDLADLPYSMLGLPQYETERILTDHLASFGVGIERGVTLEALTQGAEDVQATLVNAAGARETARFRHVVGCDGAHSTVRHALGIAFDGSAFPSEFILGDVKIDWSLPRGMTVRALHPVQDGPPDLFVAVPLPELGRYRVSMLAPPELAPPGDGGGGHGIQSERPAPGLDHLQAAADRLLTEKARLSDLRWSSIFRISMRLAASYRQGRGFLAGDAAHIHPPTGGQGMNTGIQDAYNLAWKMALVLRHGAPATLLDSYEAERRPVGEEVVAHTTAASVRLGHEKQPDPRLADTQVLVNYRTSAWVAGAPAGAPAGAGPSPGDRVPDCENLRRQGVGHTLRLLDVLRGTEHVLVANCPQGEGAAVAADLTAVAASQRQKRLLRVVQIVAAGDGQDLPGVACYTDGDGRFRQTFGPAPTFLLIRPDGYLAWRGASLADASLRDVLQRTFGPA